MPGLAVRTPQELVEKTYGAPAEWKRGPTRQATGPRITLA